MSVKIRKYKMGCYRNTTLPPKPRQKAIIRLKRRNKTYAHSITKYRKARERRNNLIALLLMTIALSANIAYAQFNSLSNSITINGNFVDAQAETQLLVDTRPEEDVVPSSFSSGEVENYIVKEAIKHGVNPDKALKIARCENTNLNPSLKNPNPNSTATGIYQWTIGSWKYYSKMFWNDTTDYRKDYKKNIELAMLTMQKYGFKDWKASESCWSF